MHRIPVGIMGASLGTANRGVSALGASLVKLVSEAMPEAEATMLIGNRDSHPYQLVIDGRPTVVPVVNFRLSPKSALKENLLVIAALALAHRFLPFGWCRRSIRRHCPWIGTVAEAALVGDIRGGDSFSDIYGLRNFLVASLPVMTVIWVRGSIVLFPQTYGPFKHWLARSVAGYILRHATVILSRDMESMETVRGLIGPADKIRFCPDVAFALEVVHLAEPAIEPPLPAIRPDCMVGLNVNGLMFNGGYTRQNMFGLKLDYRTFLQQLVAALLAEDSIHVLLVPHTFGAPGDVESDPQACRDVMSAVPPALRQRVHLVAKEYDQHELKGIIGGCDFFIGSRMHSCIAALSQGVPAIGVAYSKKFKGVFETVDMADWIIDGRTTNNEAAVGRIMALFREQQPARLRLRTAVGHAQSQLHDAFIGLTSTVTSSSLSSMPPDGGHETHGIT